MKIRKFVSIEIDGQDNIGVIDLGEIDIESSEGVRAEQIHKAIEAKLPEALQSHFDCEIQILQIAIITIFGHIQVNGKVRIIDCHDEEECSIEEVSLNETWVY